MKGCPGHYMAPGPARMSVRKRNGKWVVDYYPDGRKGKRKMISLPGAIKTKPEALAIEKDLRKKAKTAGMSASIPHNPTLEQIKAEVLGFVEVNRSLNTLKGYKKALKRLIPMFGSIPLNSFSQNIADQYKKKRLADGVGAKTINNEIGVLSAIINFGSKRNYNDPLPYRLEKLPYVRPLPEILSRDEIKRFLVAAEPQYRLMILCLYQTGMRWEEVSNLKWQDIDWHDAAIRVQKAKHWKSRIIPMTDELKEELDAIKRHSGLVFPSGRTGRPYLNIRKAINRTALAAGITRRLTTHMLRHTFATHLLESDTDLRTIQHLLGHSNIQTTMIYTHVAMPKMRKDIAKLNISSKHRVVDINDRRGK